MNSSLTAASRGLASCHLCLKLVSHTLHDCPRCGSEIHIRKVNSLQHTLAFLITASILYIPANLLPIMITDQLGRSTESTILGGVVLLIELGSIPIALVIFIASVMIPLAKLLVMSVHHGPPEGTRQRTVLYRITEFIGKWSLIDVFVVAILVALIHLSNLLVIRPGIATVAFAGVVIASMLAAESFDPRLMWDQLETEDE
jgi:paraquat-inducible protein A